MSLLSVITHLSGISLAGNKGRFCKTKASVDDRAKDGREKFFTTMHCVRVKNL